MALLRPWHLAVLLLLLLLVVVTAGCNAVSFRARAIVQSMQSAGLSVHDVKLHDAEVHYWASSSFASHKAAAADDRPITVLVHGFGASAMWQWYEQVGPLSQRHRLVVPDLLWFGESTSTTRDFSLDYQVQVTLALLDRLGADRVNMVGISYGGLVAYELASQRPERIDKLVIVDSPGRVYSERDYRELCQRFSVDHIADVLLPTDNDGVRQLLQLAYYDPPWTPDWALSQVRKSLYADHGPEKRALLDALINDQRTLSQRPDPIAETLLIWGAQDPVFPLPLGRRLQRHLGPHTRLRVIKLARHAPNLEYPDEFNAILAAFLR